MVSRCFRRLISFFLSFSLLFQSFAPGIILAQEVDIAPSPTPTEVIAEPTPQLERSETPSSGATSPELTATPTPTDFPVQTAEPPVGTSTPTLTEVLTPTPAETPITPTEIPLPAEVPTPIPTPTPTSLWTEIDSDTLITINPVAEGVNYHYRDTNLVVRFTKIDQPGKLTIRQIKLTPDQIVASGALSDTAYDITSDMPNGSFLYDLTLPLTTTESDIAVKYASSDDLTQSQEVTQTEEVGSNIVTIRDLDHFTIFYVSAGKDKATNGSFCGSLGNQCSFNASEKTSLKYDDDNKLTIKDYNPNPDVPGFWPDLDFGRDRYVEFEFQNLNDSIDEINNAAIKVIYNTNAIDTQQPYGARLEINGPWQTIAEDVSDVGPNLSLDDQTYIIPLSASHLNRPKLNQLKARFYMYGESTDEDAVLRTNFDQVILLVNYDDTAPTIFVDPYIDPTNNTTPTISGTATDTGGSNVAIVEYRVDGGGWFPATSNDGAFDSASEAFEINPAPLAEGPHNIDLRGADSFGNIQTEMVSLSLTTDYTLPEAPGFPSSLPDPTNSEEQTWTWFDSHDPGISASGIKGYWYQISGTAVTPWTYLGNVLSLTTSLPEGTSELSVLAEDNAGNQGASSSGTLSVDTTSPTATISYSETAPTNGDVVATLVPIETVEVTNNMGSTEYTFSENGSFTFEFRDLAGNTGSTTATVGNIDKNLPTVSSMETQDNDHNGKIDAIKITFSESIDDSRLELGPDGWSVEGYGEASIGTGETENDNVLILGFPEGPDFDTAATPTVIYEPSGDIDHTSTHDISGNELDYFEGVPIDRASPVLVSAITGDADLDGSLDRVIATLSEDINGSSSTPADYQVDGYSVASESETAGIITLTLTENETNNDTGAKPIVSLISGEGSGVKDLANNWSYGENSVESADGAAPVSTLSTPTQGTYHNSAINISGSSSDSNGESLPETVDFVTLSYRVNDGEWVEITRLSNEEGSEPFEWSYDWTPEGDGTYDIKAAAADTDGNQEGSAVVTGVVFDTANPNVTFPDDSPADSLITNNANQTFIVKINEPVASCNLNLGTNRTVSSATSQITWRHTYPEDTQWTWHFYSPSGRDYAFPDRYVNAGPGWNQFVSPVVYDMTSIFSSDQLAGDWRLQMRDNVGWDRGAITQINLLLNGTSHLWTGSAGIWDYHTTTVDIPVSDGGRGGDSNGIYPMTVTNEDGLGTAEVTISGIANATYDYDVECSDRAGNAASSVTRSITVDTVSPTGEITYSTSEYTNGTVTATLNPSETVTVTNNGGSFNYVFSANGSFEFTFTDQAGNTGSATATVGNIDTTDPESVIREPQNDGSGNTIYTNDWNGTIEGTATDNLSGLARVELSIKRASDGLYWDGEGWTESGEGEPRVNTTGTSSWSYSLSNPAEDSYEIVSHAVDNVGNVEDSYKLTIVLDQTIPEVAISLNPADPDSGNGWYKTDPEITLTATDDKLTDHIEYQWNRSTGVWIIYSLLFKTPGEGNHVLYYRAFDKAGNVSGLGIKNIKYDKTDLDNGPLNVSVSPNPTSRNTARVKWDGAKDNVGIEKYEVNWSLDGTSISYTDTVGNQDREHEINRLDQEGKWNVKVTAFDSAGNRQSGSVELTVDRTAPAAPTLTLVGTSVGEAILSWNSLADAADYIIWYGNNSGNYLFGARVGNVTNFTVRGLGAGDYYFIVRGVDGAGNQSSNSNEVSTLALVGAPGVEPGTPAEGFSEEVKGESTSIEHSPTPPEAILGENQTNDQSFPWWLIMLLVASGGIGAWVFFRRS